MTKILQLRDVTESDLPILFVHQLDPVASLMAAFRSRDQTAFKKHWKNKILSDTSVVKKAIVADGQVVGNIVSWQSAGKQLVGYWIGKEHWGKGLATQALAEFVKLLEVRPLYAHVASHNKASIRVLEKCGFTHAGHGVIFSEAHNHEIEETILTFL